MDKRRHNRKNARLGARIILNGGTSAITVVVHNISFGGAEIRVAIPAGIPDEFTLEFDDTRHPKRQCRIAWRRTDRIGVQFNDFEDAVVDCLACGAPATAVRNKARERIEVNCPSCGRYAILWTALSGSESLNSYDWHLALTRAERRAVLDASLPQIGVHDLPKPPKS